jgi:hypothetical protein
MDDENDDDSSPDPITKDVLDALGAGSCVITFHATSGQKATMISSSFYVRVLKNYCLPHYNHPLTSVLSCFKINLQKNTMNMNMGTINYQLIHS